MRTESQNKKIAKWLLKGHHITPLEALNLFGCYRLSARIHDLRNGVKYPKALNIRTRIVARGNKHFAEYSLIK